MEHVKITFESTDGDRKVIINLNPIDEDRLETSIVFEPELDDSMNGENTTYAMVAMDFMNYLTDKRS